MRRTVPVTTLSLLSCLALAAPAAAQGAPPPPSAEPAPIPAAPPVAAPSAAPAVPAAAVPAAPAAAVPAAAVPAAPAAAAPPPLAPRAEEEPPPTPAAPARWRIDASIFGSLYGVHYPSLVPGGTDVTARGNRVGASLGVARYFKEVVDDDAPRSLQPYLQRVGSLGLGVNGGALTTRAPFGGQDRTSRSVGAGAGVDVYATPTIALTGGLRYGYGVLEDVGLLAKSHTFAAGAGLGVRLGDVRIDLGYTFDATSTNGTFAPVQWGTVSAEVFAVFARRFTLDLGGNVNAQGGSGGATFGAYVDKDFGIFLGGYGGRLRFNNGPYAYRFGGNAELSYWVTPIARFGITYLLNVTKVPEQVVSGLTYADDQVEHAASLEMAWRF